MRKKVKNTLIVSLVAMILLTILAVSVSAITTCKSDTCSFTESYEDNIGCDNVQVPISMSKKSAKTKISAPTGTDLDLMLPLGNQTAI